MSCELFWPRKHRRSQLLHERAGTPSTVLLLWLLTSVPHESAGQQPEDVLLSNATLPEHNEVDQLIGTLSIVPAALEPLTSYAIAADQSPTWRFRVQGRQLRAAQSFDYNTEKARQPFVRVVASTDGFAVPLRKQFNITIVDVNLRPTDILLDLTAASSNPSDITKFDTTLGTFRTVDPDEPAAQDASGGGSSGGSTAAAALVFTYTLVSGSGDADNGALTIDGSTLKTRDWHFADASYSFRVRSTDEGGLFYEKQFVVTKGSDSSSIAIGFAVGVGAFLVLGLLLLLLLWLAKKRGWKLRCCCCCCRDEDEADALPLRSGGSGSSGNASGKRPLSSSRSGSTRTEVVELDDREQPDDDDRDPRVTARAKAELLEAVREEDAAGAAGGSMILLPGQPEPELPKSTAPADARLRAAVGTVQRVFRRRRFARTLRTELAGRAERRRAARDEAQRQMELAMAAAQRMAEMEMEQQRRAEIERVRLEQAAAEAEAVRLAAAAAAAEEEKQRAEAEQRRLAQEKAEQQADEEAERQRLELEAEVVRRRLAAEAAARKLAEEEAAEAATNTRWSRGQTLSDAHSPSDPHSMPPSVSDGHRSGYRPGGGAADADALASIDAPSAPGADDGGSSRSGYRRGGLIEEDEEPSGPGGLAAPTIGAGGTGPRSSYRRGGLAAADEDADDDTAGATTLGSPAAESKPAVTALQQRRHALLGLLAPADRMAKQDVAPFAGLVDPDRAARDPRFARRGALADDQQQLDPIRPSRGDMSTDRDGDNVRRFPRHGNLADELDELPASGRSATTFVSRDMLLRDRAGGPAQRGVLRTDDPAAELPADKTVWTPNGATLDEQQHLRRGPALRGNLEEGGVEVFEYA